MLSAKRTEETIRDIPVVIVSGQDPRERPVTSEVLLVGLGEGLSLNQVARCSYQLSALLLRPG